MDFRPLPFDAGIQAYERQAAALLESYRAGDPRALDVFHRRHPRFLDATIPWLPKPVSDAEIRSAGLNAGDARLVLARAYDYLDWPALSAHAEEISRGGAVREFEAAVDAVTGGDLEGLRMLLRRSPELIRSRSIRVTCFDPPVHRATLLHYVAANGVEGYRQKTPPNAVDIARELLERGAAVDALASLYGGQCTTLSLLVSSSPPADAGLQIPLAELLIGHGASLDECGEGSWTSPLMTALTFGFVQAAETLVQRGAKVDRIAAAAGLGRSGDVRRLLPASGPADRHRALALAAQLGHAPVVELLLDAGEDPNRYNPQGSHAHATPLHQAVWGGHESVVRLLVERGARLDIRDTIYRSTPLGWAEYGQKPNLAAYLRERGGA